MIFPKKWLKNSNLKTIVLAVLPGLVFIFFFLYFFYSSRTFPNTYLGSFEISNLSDTQVSIEAGKLIDNFESSPISIQTNNESIQVATSDLGVYFDRDKTAENIQALKKNPLNFLSLNKTVFKPIYFLDSDKFNAQIQNILHKYSDPPSDATIVFTSGGFTIKKESSGHVIDSDLLISQIRSRLDDLSIVTIEVSRVNSEPKILEDQAKAALDKVNKIYGKRIVFVYGRDRWEISGNKLLDLLRFYPEGQDSRQLMSLEIISPPIVLVDADFGSGSKVKNLDVSLDRLALNEFILKIADSVDTPTTDAQISIEGGKVVGFSAARDGQELDKEKTVETIFQKLNDEKSGSEIVINLPVQVTRAKIANEEVNSLGIRELIGRGESYFAGSIPNRVFNVGLGAKRVSGTIVPPNETFSFNGTVGEVSGKTGYKQAYVISQGRTVLDDGGGICQVSTTVFRAALNAGLPIIARTAHAYRVGYYEQRGFKPGLDATVWSPSVDLKFKNDTGGHILVQTLFDPTISKLQVDIYGTSDGRRVVLGDPVISNQKPAPDDKFQDDPGLPKGTKKQVDFSAAGATSVFTRKVYKENELIYDDTFKSVYRPWQAVYLVGTGG